MTTDPSPHIFWLVSRASGTAALLLASLGVCVGLLMGGRFVRGRGLDLRASHEAISLATLTAIVVHALSLLGDKFLSPNLADLTIPFVSGYKTLWTTTGIVAGWGLLLLGGSYYARRLVGPARWRMLHRFTVLFWALGAIHSVGEGTDARSSWFLVLTAVAVVPPTALFLARVMKRRPSRPAPAAAH
jgi:predicted ferric reductase